MKKLIISSIIAVVGATSAMAQNASETFVGYSFLKQNVESTRSVARFDENTDSHGFVVSHSRYFMKTKTVGLTGEVGANFDTNEASLVTALGGVVFKAQQEATVRPFAKALIGYARQRVDRNNILNSTDAAGAYSLGGGFDVVVKGGYQWRVGADYLNTGFGGVRQNAVRFSTGLVF